MLVCLPAWAADAPVPVRIRVLQGFRQGAPGVPPGLEDLRGQLSATAYVRWEQAGEMQASMVPGKTQPVSLPAGGIGLGEARRGAAGGGHLRGERPGVADPVAGHGAAGEAHRAAGLGRAGRERLVRDHQGGGVAGRGCAGRRARTVHELYGHARADEELRDVPAVVARDSGVECVRLGVPGEESTAPGRQGQNRAPAITAGVGAARRGSCTCAPGSVGRAPSGRVGQPRGTGARCARGCRAGRRRPWVRTCSTPRPS